MRPSVRALCGASILVGLALAPVHAADMAAGKRLAGAKCRACHGLDGIAKMPIAPHLAGESDMYLQTQLKAFRAGKRESEMMSVVAKDLTDAEIADLAAWYSAIKISVTLPE
jgi:cytochrome c553